MFQQIIDKKKQIFGLDYRYKSVNTKNVGEYFKEMEDKSRSWFKRYWNLYLNDEKKDKKMTNKTNIEFFSSNHTTQKENPQNIHNALGLQFNANNIANQHQPSHSLSKEGASQRSQFVTNTLKRKETIVTTSELIRLDFKKNLSPEHLSKRVIPNLSESNLSKQQEPEENFSDYIDKKYNKWVSSNIKSILEKHRLRKNTIQEKVPTQAIKKLNSKFMRVHSSKNLLVTNKKIQLLTTSHSSKSILSKVSKRSQKNKIKVSDSENVDSEEDDSIQELFFDDIHASSSYNKFSKNRKSSLRVKKILPINNEDASPKNLMLNNKYNIDEQEFGSLDHQLNTSFPSEPNRDYS